MSQRSWKPVDETAGVLVHMSIVEHYETVARRLRAMEEE